MKKLIKLVAKAAYVQKLLKDGEISISSLPDSLNDMPLEHTMVGGKYVRTVGEYKAAVQSEMDNIGSVGYDYE